MSKSRGLVLIAISFAAGVLAASRFDISEEPILIFLAICTVVFAFCFISRNKICALVALFLFFAGLGVLRLNASNVQNEYQNLFETKQELTGFITEDPDIRTGEQLITFTPNGFKQNILVNESLEQKFFYGDEIVVTGKIQEAKSFEDFDYKKYLERFNVYAVSGFDKILILKSHRLNPIKEFFLRVKAAFIKRADELMPSPNNSLLISILIGAHKNLPQNIVDNFNTTGTSHIIAVSGFNITIIITALASLAFLIGRRASFWLSLSALGGFLIITGLSASVLRAAIMGFLLLVALNVGRQYSIVPSLFFAGLVMLIINPKILYWDVGFQLSFAATLGIVYFFPLLGRLTEKIPECFGVKSLLLTTLSAIVSTMPLILFSFGNLSLSAPIVNILILPAVPPAMLFGFLIFIPILGSGFAFAANLLLVYMTKVLAFFAGLPFSCLNFQISAWVLWLLIAAVFGLYFLLLRLVKRQEASISSGK